MDPNETLADLMDALTGQDWDEAYDKVTDLQDWLDGGGFPPDANKMTWRNLMDGIKTVLEETV